MRKKLFAVIMSAMMMITFMPTMAFAAITGYSNYTWNEAFTHVDYTVTDDVTGTYSDGSDAVAMALTSGSGATTAFTGQVKAVAKNTALDSEEGKGFATYYDLDNAKVSEINGIGVGRITLAQAKTMFNDFSVSTVNAGKVAFSVPSYVRNYADKYNAPTDPWTIGDLDAAKINVPSNTTFKVEVPTYDESKKFEDQTFELAVTPEYQSGCPNYKGHLPKVKVTIAKETPTVGAAEYRFDNFQKTDTSLYRKSSSDYNVTASFFYDGAEHTLSQVEMSGITSTYEIWSETEHKYVAADKVTVKNAGLYDVKATAVDAQGNKDTKNFKITVQKAPWKLKFGFMENDTYNPAKAIYSVGNNYNAMDFVEAVKGADNGFSTDSGLTADKAWDSAIKADKEVFKSYLNDYCQVKLTEKTFAKGTFDAKLVDNEKLATMSAADLRALEAKYKDTALNNYVFAGSPILAAKDSAVFNVADSVSFSKAVLNHSYKAKKGKLPKNKTFTVKAKAASGAKVVYSLANGGSQIKINKTSGKVTLKKGLKKGTYNIKITAKADTYVGTYNTFTTKIKVK